MMPSTLQKRMEELTPEQKALLALRLKQKNQTATTRPATISPILSAGQPTPEQFPLSYAQQRLWFLDQLHPGEATYNILDAFEMQGELNPAVLEQCLQEIVHRHTILQMIYTSFEDTAVLQRHPRPELTLPHINLSHTPEKLQTYLDQLAQTPFDLTQELPIRVYLLILAPNHHVLVLNIHHIATDEWSTGLLIQELTTLYTAYTAGATSSPLPALPIQYVDYAHWQRQQLEESSHTFTTQLAYWKQKLAQAPATLDLPTDHPRPAVKTFNGTYLWFSVPSSLANTLRNLAQTENVTLFMLFQTAFLILLKRYTQQEDIILGTPIAGRNRAELENLLGFFVNTLALRTDLSGQPTVRQLLKRVRQTTLEGFVHQDIPFEKIVAEVQPGRVLNQTPLFQVLFNFLNVNKGELKLPGLTIKGIGGDTKKAKFDLALTVEDVGHTFDGNITYNTDLFEETTIQRMVGHLTMILEQFLLGLDQPIEKIILLPQAEQQLLRDTWNNNKLRYPAHPAVQTLIETQSQLYPEQLAVICEGESLTYAQLNSQANQLAHFLRQKGITPHTKVALFIDRSLDLLVSMLAVLKAGGAYIPLDPVYPADRIGFIMSEAGVPLVLTHSQLRPELPDLPGVEMVVLDEFWPQLANQPTSNLPLVTEPNHLMYVLFTSGSTGLPKGVGITHANYLNYVQGLFYRLQINRPGLHFAIASTFAADLGTTNVYGALCSGGCVHILPYERAVNPAGMVSYFQQHHIDVMKLVPSHFEAIQSAPGWEAVIPHQHLIFAGEACKWELIEEIRQARPDCQLHNHYGPTETTVSLLMYPIPQTRPGQYTNVVPLGRPIPNVPIYVLDNHLQLTPQGIPGELFIGGPGVAPGYLNRPDLTAQSFIPDPFSPAGRLYRTGDRVRYLADGSIEFLGRVDFQIKIRGYRVEPSEIEALLRQHPAVAEAVVILREDTPGDKQLVAYLVPQQPNLNPFDPRPVRDLLRDKLPDYMVPAVFVPISAIPLNPNGKIDRHALPIPTSEHRLLGGEYMPPRTPAEEEMARIWAEVLQVERVGIHDNFFDLGGESFKAIRVARQMPGNISVMALFRNPTIAELSQFLSSSSAPSDDLLCQLTRPSHKTPFATLVCVPYGGGNAISYQPLADALPATYALYAVQLPGHEFTRPDIPLTALKEVARQCVAEIQAKINTPIVIYGHCLGGALAVELGRQCAAQNIKVEGVFLAGTFPSARPPGRFFALFGRWFANDWASDRSYYDNLRALGGFTDEIDPAELQFMVRSLRHDIHQSEEYFTEALAQENYPKLDIPLVCIIGERDRATQLYEERYHEWEFFSNQVGLEVIPQAGHFFLKHQAQEVGQIIDRQVRRWQNRPELTSKPAHTITPAVWQKPTLSPSFRVFLVVAFGQFISMIGTSLTSFALGVWVFQRTGAVSDFAQMTALTMLPGLILAPVAGTLADRFDKRKMMIASDILAACGTLILFYLWWTDSIALWHLYVVALMGSVANTFQGPAYGAAVAQLVPKPYLGHANGLVGLGGSVGNLLALLFGGALVTLIDLQGVLFIDFLSFLVAISTLLVVRFPNMLYWKREEPWRVEVTQGWRYIRQRPGFVAMVLFFLVFNLFVSQSLALITPYVLTQASPELLGLILATGAVGAISGGVTMTAWGGTKRRTEGMIGAAVTLGAAVLLVGISPFFPLMLVGIFAMWFSFAVLDAHWQAIIQTKAGLELQGRVLATNRMLATLMMPLGYLLVGPLVDGWLEPWMQSGTAGAQTAGWLFGNSAGSGMALLLTICGFIMTVWGILGFNYPTLRYLEDEIPDTLPEAVIQGDKDSLQAQADKLVKIGNRE